MPTPIPAVALAFVLGASTCVRGQEPVPKPTGPRAQAGDEPARTLEIRVERPRDRQVIDGFGGSLAYWGYNADETALRHAFEDLGATIVRIPAEVPKEGDPDAYRDVLRRVAKVAPEAKVYLTFWQPRSEDRPQPEDWLDSDAEGKYRLKPAMAAAWADEMVARVVAIRRDWGANVVAVGVQNEPEFLAARHPHLRLGARPAGRLHGLRVRPAPGRRGAGAAPDRRARAGQHPRRRGRGPAVRARAGRAGGDDLLLSHVRLVQGRRRGPRPRRHAGPPAGPGPIPAGDPAHEARLDDRDDRRAVERPGVAHARLEPRARRARQGHRRRAVHARRPGRRRRQRVPVVGPDLQRPAGDRPRGTWSGRSSATRG